MQADCHESESSANSLRDKLLKKGNKIKELGEEKQLFK